MTPTELTINIGVAVIGLGLSALFSGTETGLYTINRVRLAVRADRGEAGAIATRNLLRSPRRMLATILIGNNVANYMTSFGIAAMLDSAGFSPGKAILLNAVLLIPILFVFGEVLPKDLFRTHTDSWTYRVAPTLTVIQWILTILLLVPIVQTIGGAVARLCGGDDMADLSARQRVGRLIKEGLGAGVLSEEQVTLADRALALRHRTVDDEMIPWPEVVTISIDAGPETRRALMRRRDFTRLPVVDRHGGLAGTISLIDVVLDPDGRTAEQMTDAVTMPAGTPVREALRVMRRNQMPMAVVVSANGRPIGLVTIKDLVEPLTGELHAW